LAQHSGLDLPWYHDGWVNLEQHLLVVWAGSFTLLCSSRTCLGQSVGMRVFLHALSMDAISLAINLDGCWEFFEANIVKPSISNLSRL
jgi:hypothetical protein